MKVPAGSVVPRRKVPRRVPVKVPAGSEFPSRVPSKGSVFNVLTMLDKTLINIGFHFLQDKGSAAKQQKYANLMIA